MRNAIVLAILFVVLIENSQGQQDALIKVKDISAEQNQKAQQIEVADDYDPLAVLAHFLYSVYPDLDQAHGLASLQIGFVSGSFQLGSVSFEFHPCRMSGVSAGPPSPIPYCGTAPKNPFLNVGLSFSRDRQRPFVFGYTAQGDFVSAKLQAVRDQFKNRVYSDSDFRDKQRYWMTTDALEVLHSNSAKFGPENRKEFISSLPVQAIEETTGCKLRPESSEFVIRGARNPELEWTVRGVAAATKHREEEECWATFEPFEGRLTDGWF